MIGIATAEPCGHQHQWTAPPHAEPRWYGVDFMSSIYALPACWVCGDGVVMLDVRISEAAE